jgi:hypothetical protein
MIEILRCVEVFSKSLMVPVPEMVQGIVRDSSVTNLPTARTMIFDYIVFYYRPSKHANSSFHVRERFEKPRNNNFHI